MERALDEISKGAMTGPVVIPEMGCFAISDDPAGSIIANGFGFKNTVPSQRFPFFDHRVIRVFLFECVSPDIVGFCAKLP